MAVAHLLWEKGVSWGKNQGAAKEEEEQQRDTGEVIKAHNQNCHQQQLL